jgi:hypothetical protein
MSLSFPQVSTSRVAGVTVTGGARLSLVVRLGVPCGLLAPAPRLLDHQVQCLGYPPVPSLVAC